MKKILYSIIAALGIFAVSSCSDMMQTDNDSQVIDPDLNSKTDSIFYALGIAQAMQQLADQYYFVGEMRGELVTTTTSTNTNLRNLADFSATTANKYDSAYVYYKVINNCNYYLAHRDTTLYTGATNVTINEYAAVAAWRAWAYLQLARTYGDGPDGEGLPFFTQPLTAISQISESNFPKKKLVDMVDALAPTLERFSGMSVPTYGVSSYSIGQTNWGRTKYINFSRIFVPVDIILGEMYLEQGTNYAKAASYYAKYLCDNKLTSSDIHSFRTSNFISNRMPENFSSDFNSLSDSYVGIFTEGSNPLDVLTYIPMAVSSQRGKTTDISKAYGYDYYSTSQSSGCPIIDDIQIEPSKAFYAQSDSSVVYYYPENSESTLYPVSIGMMKLGDGRANSNTVRANIGNSVYILNRLSSDTTKVYVSKMRNANVYLYRTTTVYLHLAEALNRMGYPELAFAILRNGISTYLEELVPSADAPQEYQYLSQKDIDLLKTQVPFLNATNRNIFVPENTYGIHHHGAGFNNAKGNENLQSVSGSQATSVGSRLNLMYLPKPIIGEKLAELASTFPGVTFGTTKADSINAMEDILCDEYAKEFAFEGLRFYDLQRMARHKNESGLYGGNFGSVWFAKKLEGNNPKVSLLEPKNWYLPFK